MSSVRTSIGVVDVSRLDVERGIVDDGEVIIEWTEYRLRETGVIVRRDAHVLVKKWPWMEI